MFFKHHCSRCPSSNNNKKGKRLNSGGSATPNTILNRDPIVQLILIVCLLCITSHPTIPSTPHSVHPPIPSTPLNSPQLLPTKLNN